MDPEQTEELARWQPPSALSRWLGLSEPHELVRFWVLRLLGLVYLAAYASMSHQVLPLLGRTGLTPAATYVSDASAGYGSAAIAFLREPSLFFLITPSDLALRGLALLGTALSCALLCGITNAGLMLVLWAIYLSFIPIGQIWYGYGWELLLLETGFLAIFLCPLRGARAFPSTRAPVIVVWLLRWLAFRVMLGAGLIKLRGDPCWRDLTCLDFHFETQPLPNPLSVAFHFLPHGVHAAGVVFNHVAELLCPLLIFAPSRVRRWSALVMIVFQVTLIVSGNLSFLNWLTLVPLVACLDDAWLRRVTPAELRRRLVETSTAGKLAHALNVGLLALVALLSVDPVLNLFASRQRMNGSYDPFMLVNTYGAFGSVGRERDELIFEGTSDATPSLDADWRAYEFPCKPGDPARAPCVISPYQPRLDWQVWFAAMGDPQDAPWTLYFVWKLLHGDAQLRTLLARDPFESGSPRYVRVLRYRYRFAAPSEQGWWKRELVGTYLPPLGRDDPRLRAALVQTGFLR
ncbi:MAG: lipase maturation factor family protein [Myxococcales bacterium]